MGLLRTGSALLRGDPSLPASCSINLGKEIHQLKSDLGFGVPLLLGCFAGRLVQSNNRQ